MKWVTILVLIAVVTGCATQKSLGPAGKPVIVQPEDGKDIHAFGSVLTVLLSGEQTGKTMTVINSSTLPDSGPPLHVHHNEDELFLVIDGRIEYFAAGQWTEVKPGVVVYLPHDTWHRFRNIGATPAHHWQITIPSGFETFFARCAEEFAKPGGPDMNRITEISREYGIEYLPPQ